MRSAKEYRGCVRSCCPASSRPAFPFRPRPPGALPYPSRPSRSSPSTAPPSKGSGPASTAAERVRGRCGASRRPVRRSTHPWATRRTHAGTRFSTLEPESPAADGRALDHVPLARLSGPYVRVRSFPFAPTRGPRPSVTRPLASRASVSDPRPASLPGVFSFHGVRSSVVEHRTVTSAAGVRFPSDTPTSHRGPAEGRTEAAMLRGTRIMVGDEARLYRRTCETLRRRLHRGGLRGSRGAGDLGGRHLPG